MMRFLARSALFWLSCGSLFAEPVVPPPAVPSKVEPGLEEAVHWKWSVVPTDRKEWGMPLPEVLVPRATDATGVDGGAPAEARPEAYEVKKGDAIIKIARKFSMTPAQLKQFNSLQDDRIFIGQILRIPTPGELLAMEPPPPPPKPESTKKKDAGKSEEAPDLAAEPLTAEQIELEAVLLQVFLDREMFSSGEIDGKGGPVFQQVRQLYQQAHPDTAGPGELKAKALASVKQPYTTYILRADDFRFIKQRNVAPVATPASKPSPAKKKKGAKAVKAVPVMPPVTYQELVANDFLGYTSVWEFVAERFHCDEAFLRRLNASIEESPAVGASFQVPNVIPFEIEKALDLPLQPAVDPQKPVTASVANLSLLQISREGRIIAVMPMATARPGLRGRGSWKVLDAIPQPRMATKHEPRETKKPTTSSPTGNPPGAVPVADPTPGPEQSLASGPNNPVGILWINLAKANSRDPLPYGLHGTSIPALMKTKEGIGGFRLANWDVARAVRLMPAGTELQWIK